MKTINPDLSYTIDNPKPPSFKLSSNVEDAVLINVDDWKYKATSALKSAGRLARNIFSKLPSLSKTFAIATAGITALGIASTANTLLSDKETPMLMTMCPIEIDTGSSLKDYETVKGNFTIAELISTVLKIQDSPNVVSSFDSNGTEHILIDGNGGVNTPILLGLATGVIKGMDTSSDIGTRHESKLTCTINNRKAELGL